MSLYNNKNYKSLTNVLNKSIYNYKHEGNGLVPPTGYAFVVVGDKYVVVDDKYVIKKL